MADSRSARVRLCISAPEELISVLILKAAWSKAVSNIYSSYCSNFKKLCAWQVFSILWMPLGLFLVSFRKREKQRITQLKTWGLWELPALQLSEQHTSCCFSSKQHWGLAKLSVKHNVKLLSCFTQRWLPCCSLVLNAHLGQGFQAVAFHPPWNTPMLPFKTSPETCNTQSIVYPVGQCSPKSVGSTLRMRCLGN